MLDTTYSTHVPPSAILVNGPLARISATIEMAEAGDREVKMPPIITAMENEAPGIESSWSIFSGVLVADEPMRALKRMKRAPWVDSSTCTGETKDRGEAIGERWGSERHG
eukprot:scaffold5173_cov125-Isochrysis_galbana.AAC.11